MLGYAGARVQVWSACVGIGAHRSTQRFVNVARDLQFVTIESGVATTAGLRIVGAVRTFGDCTDSIRAVSIHRQPKATRSLANDRLQRW